MKKTLVLGLLMSAAVAASAQPAEDSAQPGTYALYESKAGVLYRVNTKTGEVWAYVERWVPDPEYLALPEKSLKDVEKKFEEAKKKNQKVYTFPAWQPTREEIDDASDLYIK